jgi:(R,R)-butanediol dehydrogenase/meso-butanediol dehydrogenase/diacetyl reductase
MRVASYLGDRTFGVDDRPETAPKAGQVQVAVDYVGLCGLDLQIYRGQLDARVGPSAVLGHEASGRVSALGDAVTGLSVGQPVTVMPIIWCGSCEACLGGHGFLCHRLTMLGIDAPGALQTMWNVPSEVVVALPESVAQRFASLAEPAAIAVHALAKAPVLGGQCVLVIDGGPVGLFIALLARQAGADVAIVEADRHRRIVGRTAALHMLDPAQDPIVSYVRNWTRGAGVDVAFDVSGASLGVDTAVAALSTRGRLVLVGGHSAPREVNANRILRRELQVIGASRYERVDFERAAELLATDDLPLSLFVTSTEPLDAIAKAFATLDAGGVMRVIIDMTAT